MKNQRGITLIALVITIIVLIILAGVAINLTLGENGILRRAEQSKESYNLAKEKEALEIEIMEVQVEILETEGRNATLNDLQNKIDTSKYTIELHFEPLATTENVTSVPTYAIVNRINTMYYFTVDRKLVITDVELAEPPTKYIKFSEITWENGKASITLSTTEAGTIEYKIGEDGTYQEGTTIEKLNHADVVYARINRNGQYTEEETKIIYDAVEPEEFTISVPEDDITYESLKITTTGTTDSQTGLKDYSFIVTKDGAAVKEIKEQIVTEYLVEGLAAETEYVVYMLAYDNAGNARKSNEITVTTSAMPVARMFGQYVNYPVDIDGDTSDYDWQIFYIEEDPTSPNYGATYIIPDYYVKYEKMQNSIEDAKMRLYSGTYRVWWNSTPSTATTVRDEVKEKFMYNFTTSKYNFSGETRASILLDTTIWEQDFITTQLNDAGGMAIGGPTIEMWCKSWNAAYPTQTLTPRIYSDTTWGDQGYEIKPYNDTNYVTSLYLNSYDGYTNGGNVYFPTKQADDDGCLAYWIASPNKSSELWGICYNGFLCWDNNGTFNFYYMGLRPVIYLPKEIAIEPSGKANLWNINYGATNN